MYQKPLPLNSAAHRDLRFKPSPGYAFAARLPVIPLVFSELVHIARQMPIAFALNHASLLALVSVDGQNNAHVNTQTNVLGQWQGAEYVPAYLRTYPFLVQELTPGEDEQEKTLAILFDAAAPHFQSGQGERLLDDEGQATELLKNIQSMLVAMHGDRLRTQGMVQQLDALGLLREDELKFKPAKGDGVSLKGFRVVDRQAFAALDGSQLKTLQGSGALPLVYAHLFSLSHLENGWLARQIHAQKPPTPNLEAFFNSGEGSLSFG